MSRFIWNIKNLIAWMPVLWNNFDWDYDFLLIIFKFKLDRMGRFFGSDDAIIVESEKVREEIVRCSEIVGLLINREYERRIFEGYYRIYPFYGIETVDVVDVKGNAHYQLKEMPKEQRDIFRYYSDICKKAECDLKDELFMLLRKGIGYWWD